MKNLPILPLILLLEFITVDILIQLFLDIYVSTNTQICFLFFFKQISATFTVLQLTFYISAQPIPVHVLNYVFSCITLYDYTKMYLATQVIQGIPSLGLILARPSLYIMLYVCVFVFVGYISRKESESSYDIYI